MRIGLKEKCKKPICTIRTRSMFQSLLIHPFVNKPIALSPETIIHLHSVLAKGCICNRFDS
jgi:hypothetical protein